MPIRTGRLADPCAPEASVIVQSHLAAGKKISDRCHRLPTAVRAGTDREDKIPKGEPSARLEDLPMSFHIVSVSFESSSGAISHCEYLVHKSHAVIHSLCTLEVTVERHFCSIFKHKYLDHLRVTVHSTAWSLPACLCRLEIDLREFEARISNICWAGLPRNRSVASSGEASTCIERQTPRSPGEFPSIVDG
jgi:hypothetical protein